LLTINKDNGPGIKITTNMVVTYKSQVSNNIFAPWRIV